MTELNGHANHGDGPENWVIALDNGRTLVGRVAPLERLEVLYATGERRALGDPQPLRLSPVFEIGVVGQQVGPNQVRWQWVGQPILQLPSFDSLELGKAATIKPVVELAPEDQAKVQSAIQAGIQQAMSMRAAAAGISLASGGEKLPPVPGRRG